MNVYKSLAKYLLGAVAGILFVVGCGSGGGGMSVGSAVAADPSNPSDQLFCQASPSAMVGSVVDPFSCMSKSDAQPQTFQNFHGITQAGWILVQFSTAASSGTYLFYK